VLCSGLTVRRDVALRPFVLSGTCWLGDAVCVPRDRLMRRCGLFRCGHSGTCWVGDARDRRGRRCGDMLGRRCGREGRLYRAGARCGRAHAPGGRRVGVVNPYARVCGACFTAWWPDRLSMARRPGPGPGPGPGPADLPAAGSLEHGRRLVLELASAARFYVRVARGPVSRPLRLAKN
jgi:hypothetical protein